MDSLNALRAIRHASFLGKFHDPSAPVFRPPFSVPNVPSDPGNIVYSIFVHLRETQRCVEVRANTAVLKNRSF